MAESTMSLAWTDFKTKVGIYLGLGMGDTSPGVFANTQSQYIVDDCLRGGLEQVVKPPVLPGDQSSHNWTWLTPVMTVAIPQNATEIPMPDDFGGIEGKVFITDSAADTFEPIKIFNTEYILAKYAAFPSFTGPIECAAVDWSRGTTATQGQRAKLMFFPQADQAYTMTIQYYYLSDCLNGTNPFPPGGAFLAETINASCKAYAEQHYNNVPQGPMWMAFMTSLRASVEADKRNMPQTGGYNGDSSDRYFAQRPWDYLHRPSTVTYVG